MKELNLKLIFFTLEEEELEHRWQWFGFYRRTNFKDVHIRLFRLLGFNVILYLYKISVRERKQNIKRGIDKLLKEINAENEASSE